MAIPAKDSAPRDLRNPRGGATDGTTTAVVSALQSHYSRDLQILPAEEQAALFVRTVYSGEPPGWLPVFSAWVAGDDKQTLTVWHRAGDLDSVIATIIRESAKAGRNVYAPVGLQRQQLDAYHRGDAAGVCALVGLWADVDVAGDAHKSTALPPDDAAALALVDDLPLKPTLTIHSGHGLQCWWLWREPWVLETSDEHTDAADLARRWAATVQSVASRHGYQLDDVGDLARVLRVPGTVNRKANCDPVPVRLLSLDDDNRYNLDDFEPYLIDIPDDRNNGRTAAQTRNLSLVHELPKVADALAKLSPSRCENYDGWLQVGMALSELGDVGLELWDDWSRQSKDKYQPGACAAKWGSFRPGQGITLASLMHWAREDSPVQEQAGAPRENLTDLGNARRMARKHGEHLRHCHPWGRWLVWDGKRWALDDTAAVDRLAKDTVASIYAEAAACPEESHRKDLAKHALRSEAANKLRAMMDLARSEPGIPVVPDQLDTNPWLLTVANGSLDLRTGRLRPHNPEDLTTKLAPVAYDPKAACPRWLSFLEDIFEGNAALIAYVQKMAGYALTGDTSEQSLFVLWGSGSNGKSTLLGTLGAMMGDYWKQTSTETLLVRPGSTIPNDLAALKGARLVTAIEADEGRRLAESLVKQITGGDPLAARFMRAEWFNFLPTFKLFLATNHKPEIRGTDHAIWRRIRLIPFQVTVPENKQDKRLGDKLKDELPGILAWAVRGCLAWQRDGMKPPAEVLAATTQYREEMDTLADFLAERCLELRNVSTEAGTLFKAYTEWCERSGEKPQNQRQFGLRLTERGFTKDRNGTTRRYQYHGIALRQAESPNP